MDAVFIKQENMDHGPDAEASPIHENFAEPEISIKEEESIDRYSDIEGGTSPEHEHFGESESYAEQEGFVDSTGCDKQKVSFTPEKDTNCQSFIAAINRSDGKRKRIVLSIIDKLKIIEKLETGTSTSAIASEYGIGISTVKDLKKNRESLKKFALQFDPATKRIGLSARKTLKMANYKSLEEAVYKWYRQQRSAGEEVQGVNIQAAADRIAKQLGIDKFSASSGWLYRFRHRHGIPNRTLHDETIHIDSSSIDPFRENLHKVVSGARLLQSQIYTISETVIRWRSLPEDINALKQDPLLKKRISKDTFSTMLCANVDGRHKLKSVIVWKLSQRLLPNNWIDQLPIHYYTSENGWFNRDMISDWFFHYFEPEVRSYQVKVLNMHPDTVKAVLVLENVPWHPEVNEMCSLDGKIRCFAFPSAAQPSESGTIAMARRLYLKKYLNQVIAVLDNCGNQIRGAISEKSLANMKGYNFKSAVFNWVDSWNELKPSIIENASKTMLHNTEPEEDFGGVRDVDYHKILAAAGEQLTLKDVALWLESESEIHRCNIISNGEISQNATNTLSSSLVDSDDIKITKSQKLSVVRDSVDYIINFVDATDDPAFADYYVHLRNLRNLVILRQRQKVTKSNFHQFFMPPSVPGLFSSIPSDPQPCIDFAAPSSDAYCAEYENSELPI